MSRETIAIIIVAALFGQFLLLLAASLVRSRRATKVLAGAAEGAEPAPEPEPEKKEKAAPKPVSRREFFRRSLLTSLGLFGAQFGAASIAFLWPTLRGGFGSLIELDFSAEAVKSQIARDRQPFYFGAGRFYLVEYDGNDEAGRYEGFVSDGLMALFQKCVHLGCRVPFCEQSQWFECPCHGSKYNRVGEYQDGPAPRGLDRFPIIVEGGTIVVDTTSPEQNGPPRGVDTINQDPEGAFCTTIGAE